MAENKPESKSIKVQIFGNEFTIKNVYDPDYIESLASYVDKKMKEVAGSSGLVSTNKIAILAALNIAEELFGMHDKKSKSKDVKIIKEKIESLIQKIDNKLGQ